MSPFEADIELMAGALGVAPADVLNLKADRAKMLFEWIERNMQTGETRRGKLSFAPSSSKVSSREKQRQSQPQVEAQACVC